MVVHNRVCNNNEKKKNIRGEKLSKEMWSADFHLFIRWRISFTQYDVIEWNIERKSQALLLHKVINEWTKAQPQIIQYMNSNEKTIR